MDYEQLFAQFILAVFAILFTFIINSTQKGVEEDNKMTAKEVNQLTVKSSLTEDQDNELLKQILRERLHHHNHRIVAASVKQVVEDEIEKLQHISDSIRSIRYHPSNSYDHMGKRQTIITNMARKGSNLWEMERKIQQLKASSPEVWSMHSNSPLSNDSTKTQHRIKRYSVYHYKVYLKNGITPLSVN